MNEGLFKKYTQQILSRVDAKQKILITLKEQIGVELNESEISLSGKTVTISTSSVKKAILLHKGIKDVLLSLGYTLEH